MLGPHKNLLVWDKSMCLVKMIYQLTDHYPKSELFSLTNQMRRCVVSIPSNIAEGYGRGTNRELVHFLYISLGSSNELDTQLILSHELTYLNDQEYEDVSRLNDEVSKMLHSLIHIRSEHPDTISQYK